MSVKATYFGSSGWLIEFANFRVLIDPWLRGKLAFPPGPWLIEGSLANEVEIPQDLDLILLTQGLADHAHPPTLKEFPKSIPVLGSPSAAKVAKQLGFATVNDIKPGMTHTINQLKVEASAGAPVPNVENGYVLTHPHGSLYIEPHGFLDKNISPQILDAVITPVVDVTLPLVGAFLKGKEVLPEIIKKFQPLTVLASTTGGDATFTGFLGSLMKMEGSTKEAADSLQQTTLIDPIAGNTYTLPTQK